MHTLVEVPVGTNGGTHVPAFLAKLWKIVDDPSTNDLIGWSEVSKLRSGSYLVIAYTLYM